MRNLQKRRYDKYYGEPPAKRPAPTIRVGAGFKWNLQTLAAAADAVASGGKSPVSALNELGVRVAYSVLRAGGPAHCPSFHVAVTVADLRFEGWGSSKRAARAAAARACLAALLARAGRVLPAPHHHADFTSDDPEPDTHAGAHVSQLQCVAPLEPAPAPAHNGDQQMDTQEPPPAAEAPAPPAAPGPAPAPPAPPAPAPPASVFGAALPPAAVKSPINVLYENYSGLTFSCTFGDGTPLNSAQAPLQLSHSMRFKVVCTIKDQKFEGYGSSKKLAKLAAARAALAVLEQAALGSPPLPRRRRPRTRRAPAATAAPDAGGPHRQVGEREV
ncbi:unnamed protein product [Chrysodeixis includens]|uniref:DRBM domain-containing protein n=1 Tax=Chrysodeixis includens TaxID=689277 RepID=A0A9P0FUZ5_CHRIL|nr:unnamed protein product [Chrysodeixis includens]